jgi:hypothetical protein
MSILQARRKLPGFTNDCLLLRRVGEILLLFSAFRFEKITYRAARNRFAFHGITSEDDFGF